MVTIRSIFKTWRTSYYAYVQPTSPTYYVILHICHFCTFYLRILQNIKHISHHINWCHDSGVRFWTPDPLSWTKFTFMSGTNISWIRFFSSISLFFLCILLCNLNSSYFAFLHTRVHQKNSKWPKQTAILHTDVNFTDILKSITGFQTSKSSKPFSHKPSMNMI